MKYFLRICFWIFHNFFFLYFLFRCLWAFSVQQYGKLMKKCTKLFRYYNKQQWHRNNMCACEFLNETKQWKNLTRYAEILINSLVAQWFLLFSHIKMCFFSLSLDFDFFSSSLGLPQFKFERFVFCPCVLIKKKKNILGGMNRNKFQSHRKWN